MNLKYTIKDLPEVAGTVLANATTKTLLFYGDMGVGKTTLIKELARKLGVEDNLSSPTFSIVNEYALDSDKLFHFDFYRVDSEEEVLDIGIEEYFDTNHWKMVEWPEKISNLLPGESTTIKLTINDNGSRTLNLSPVN
ncbi:MAG: tRNA (adenosine(37)-N6)-threonylcarbamoyltransferase complex ATPase subunit type 1 TsaE [Bacteroidia bacterium]|nr:tRNA (adenosine(37)-N6)-threonylcarbamoyltransferase complex ATPase subunit type 1 TsaE [Bacteroidia bacterium]